MAVHCALGSEGGIAILDGEQVNELPRWVNDVLHRKHAVLSFIVSYLTMVLRQGIFILESFCIKRMLVWI